MAGFAGSVVAQTLLVSILYFTSGVTANNFIQNCCRSTVYPATCEREFLPLANSIQNIPLKLAQISLSKTIKVAKDTASFLKQESKRSPSPALKDCAGNIEDSLSQLQDSLPELSKLGTVKMALSNAQTWVSAAITNINTCLDDYPGNPEINDAVKSVIELSSISLTFINKLAPEKRR